MNSSVTAAKPTPPVIAYHFTGKTLRNGDPIPGLGEWLTYSGDVKICQSGLHASRSPWDALQYAPGEYLHQVECDEIFEEQSDKLVCRRRKIIATIDATSLLREFARKRALSVIHLWQAPDVVRRYLETGDEQLRAAARDAARAAAWDAAWAEFNAMVAASDAARDEFNATAAASAAARAEFNAMVEPAIKKATEGQ